MDTPRRQTGTPRLGQTKREHEDVCVLEQPPHCRQMHDPVGLELIKVGEAGGLHRRPVWVNEPTVGAKPSGVLGTNSPSRRPKQLLGLSWRVDVSVHAAKRTVLPLLYFDCVRKSGGGSATK